MYKYANVSSRLIAVTSLNFYNMALVKVLSDQTFYDGAR